jgi:hypothetical protein
VDWPHIREAKTMAADIGGRAVVLSPVLIALRAQSRFANLDINLHGITLVDTFAREPARYQYHSKLRAYLEDWNDSRPLEPARFTLEPAPE